VAPRIRAQAGGKSSVCIWSILDFSSFLRSPGDSRREILAGKGGVVLDCGETGAAYQFGARVIQQPSAPTCLAMGVQPDGRKTSMPDCGLACHLEGFAERQVVCRAWPNLAWLFDGGRGIAAPVSSVPTGHRRKNGDGVAAGLSAVT